MRKFMTAAVLVATMLVTASAVQAAKPGGGKSSHSGKSGSSQGKNFLSSHGTKFSHGYLYSGKQHNHWSYQCYLSRYGCNCFYCPYATCWYYWCEPRCCYLPVSCIESTPRATEVVNVVNSPGAIVSQGATKGLPPGLPSGPAGAGSVQAFKGGSITP
jgi:hypothetical protein